MGVGGEMGSDYNRYKVSFWGDENALKLIVVMVAQFCDYTKNHCILDFKWLDCMVCELYLKKAVKKIREESICCLSLLQLP